MGKPNVPLVKRPPEIPCKTPLKRLATHANVNTSRSRTREPSHPPKPTCQESLTNHNASKKKGRRINISPKTQNNDSRPWPHLDPDLVQSPKKTLQDLDKRLEIRLGNMLTSTV